MKKQDAKGFIVDGFPREIAQAFTFEEQVQYHLGDRSLHLHTAELNTVSKSTIALAVLYIIIYSI